MHKEERNPAWSQLSVLRSTIIIDDNIPLIKMTAAQEFEAANAKYAASFNKGDLQLPPQR